MDDVIMEEFCNIFKDLNIKILDLECRVKELEEEINRLKEDNK